MPTAPSPSSSQQGVEQTGPVDVRPRNKAQGSPLLLWIGLCCLVSGLFNIFHAHSLHNQQQQRHATHFDQKRSIFHQRGFRQNNAAPAQGTTGALQMAMHHFLQGRQPKHNGSVPAMVKQKTDTGDIQRKSLDESNSNVRTTDVNQPPLDTLATLSCAAHGGPDDAAAREMVYWHDIPSDATYTSPFLSSHTNKYKGERYLTFEPDGGGWNNIRMAMETVIGLAIATGRTLVLPPQQRMYLLGKDRGKQRTDFDFDHFFPIYEMAAENAGLKVISMEEFLRRVAMTGQLRNKVTGEVAFPPENRTDWNGQNGSRMTALKDYLRNSTHTPDWKPGECMAAFPNDTSIAAVDRLNHYKEQALKQPLQNPLLEHPEPVDQISPVDRLRENLSRRQKLCIYDTDAQKELVMHFMCSHKLGYRMLVHFYAFLYFEDYREDLWMKRFMRDHIRYKDPIQCAAARIVASLRKEFGEFDTFHIRRGDFQFKKTRIEATEIYHNVKDIIPDGRPIFIATDERDKKFFDPLKAHYQVRFLDDYKHLLEGVNTNFYGMIDQLVASKGDRFFGCWFSTFTGFIHRMRGYHSVNHKEEGYEDGRLPTSYYYVPIQNQKVMHTYSAIRGAFFNREFPTSWRGIDASVGDIPHQEVSLLAEA